MKKYFLLCAAALCMTSCLNDDDNGTIPDDGLRVVTFEDSSVPSVKGFWSSLIDDPQYGGPLLYQNYNPEDWTYDTEYSWADPNTKLASEIPWVNFYGSMTRSFGSGGVAISNYRQEDIKSATYEKQLAVPFSESNNSNFAVVYQGTTDEQYLPSIHFSDSKARLIRGMYITLTSYTQNSIFNGDEYTTPFDAKDNYTITFIGYNGSDEPKKVNYVINVNNAHDLLAGWIPVDLSILGKVTEIKFLVDSSKKNDYGIATPTYFAFDNVYVQLNPGEY